MTTTASKVTFIRWFADINMGDVATVGGKNASLGEMVRELVPLGIAVPNGFATTADAYRFFLESSGLDQRIHELLSDFDPADIDQLRARGSAVRHAILDTPLPAELEAAITQAYGRLCEQRGDGHADVAVRSSATAEDLPEASFAGQQETYLNVQGETQLLQTCHRCFASLFTDRAISYRGHQGYSHDDVALSIGVQDMVRSDLGSSGVMFSIDTETGFRNAVLINAAYGLGETVVQGSVNPDEYYVFKPTLAEGKRPILRKSRGNKEFKLVYALGGSKMTKSVPVPVDERRRFALSDDDILTLARWACVIEDHYSERRGSDCPMDIEWAKDGQTGALYVVQARPETVKSAAATNRIYRYHLKREGRKLLVGRAVGERIGNGRARIIRDVSGLSRFQDGEVLVTDKTDPDWEPIMKRAAAIITNRGGRTCHAAIVSRELGLPAVVGTHNATERIADGQAVTVSCAEGTTAVVYDGLLDYEVETIPIAGLQRPRTKIMLNVANPEEAFSLSMLPNDGVGLAREEFIISNYVKVHPLALLRYEELDLATRQQVDALTVGYDRKPDYYVDRLAEGVAMIAAAFYPKPVILRFSDFKSNEYANLIGGALFEPQEENPMIGFRGASRYYDDDYKLAFAMECWAVDKVRREMGLTNLHVMVPFCRTVEEGRKVICEMESHGLLRGEQGLQVYVMCEIPSNVILADEFAEVFDGFSIGSNDLTQLVLGVDRDSEIVAHVFDERNAAVKKMIADVIQTARAKGRKIGICGQAPSDYPDFARFLVEQGIDSISLTPDVAVKTTLDILELEKELQR